MSRLGILFSTLATGLLATVAQAQVNITAETASPVSVPGQTVLALGEVASSANIANIQISTGQTLTNSVQNVAEGKTDIAAAPFLLTFLLARGAGPYSALGDKGAELAGNLAVLYTYRFGTYGLFAYDSANFGGWNAIEGSTIYNGPPRGAALTRARASVQLVTGLEDGKGYSGLQVNWGQAIKTIADGSAKANLLPLNFPDGRISQAVASGDITVFSMPKDAFEGKKGKKMMRAPGSVAVAVKVTPELFGQGVTVVSEDGMFRGMGEVGGEIVNKNMNFDLAKSLTAAFIANIDLYNAKTPFMKTVYLGKTDTGFTGMCGAVSVKYHPGAVAAWEEAGYTIPDCAKP